MRLLAILALLLAFSPIVSESQDLAPAAVLELPHLQVGDWVQYKAVTIIGQQTIEIGQRYAVVGEEQDEAGARWVWLETDMALPGNRVLLKVLLPAAALAAKGTSYGEVYQAAKRWIIKTGDQPATELPVEQALAQMKPMLGLAEDPKATVADLGEEVVQTAKGQLTCTKKRYQGTASMEQAQGPMVMTIKNTYDRVIWRVPQIPITGQAKTEETGRIEVSSSLQMPGMPSPPPQQTRTVVELMDYGTGATTAITEEPQAIPAPAPTE